MTATITATHADAAVPKYLGDTEIITGYVASTDTANRAVYITTAAIQVLALGLDRHARDQLKKAIADMNAEEDRRAE